jgi:hypothetical protein
LAGRAFGLALWRQTPQHCAAQRSNGARRDDSLGDAADPHEQVDAAGYGDRQQRTGMTRAIQHEHDQVANLFLLQARYQRKDPGRWRI